MSHPESRELFEGEYEREKKSREARGLAAEDREAFFEGLR
jgi:hypothetical protein